MPGPTVTPAPPHVVRFPSGAEVTATFVTSLGTFACALFHEACPTTVGNFVALARGAGGAKPFYDGTTFHRCIPDFMVQAGDPTGTGRGGPGYTFGDEFAAGLAHDRPGILSMANAGPNTNGSQFFITEVATPWLDGKHAIFGAVTAGLDVLHAIGHAPTDADDRPQTAIALHTVTVTVA